MDSPYGGGPGCPAKRSKKAPTSSRRRRISASLVTAVEPAPAWTPPTIAAARASGAVTPDRLSQPAADPAHLDRSLEALMLVAADRDHCAYLLHGWPAGWIRSRPSS
jgi:hypothetical protein